MFSKKVLFTLSIILTAGFSLSLYYFYPVPVHSQTLNSFDNSNKTEGNSFDNLLVDKYGGIYLTSSLNHHILKIDSSGKLIGGWGSTGKEFGQFMGPLAITSDGYGSIYVADSGNNRIQKFDGNGKFLASWGSPGKGIGQFIGPLSIATDPANNVVVLDKGANVIQKFDGSGKFLAMINDIPNANASFETNKSAPNGGNFTLTANANQYKNFSIVNATPITNPNNP